MLLVYSRCAPLTQPPAQLAFVTLLCAAPSDAQVVIYLNEQLIDPTGQCVPKSQTLCNGIAGLQPGTPIYVNSTHSEDVLAQQGTPLYNLLSPLQALDKDCYSAAVLYFCLGFFTPCEEYQVNSSSIPHQPCKNVCDVGVAKCNATFTRFGQTFPPCPPDEVIYDFTASGGANFTANCSDGSSDGSSAPICTPIHELFLSKRTADTLLLLSIIFGWIGLFANIALVVLYSANPRLRNWPGPLIIMMAFFQIVFSMAMVLSTFATRRDIMCSPKKLKLCKTQGAFIFIGALYTITVWLLMTCLTLLLVIQKNPKPLQRWLQAKWWFTLPALIIPSIFFVVAAPDLGPNSISLLCTAYSGDTLERFLIWPVAGIIAIGTAAWLGTVVSSLSASVNWKRDLQLYLRLLIYELIALVPAVLLVVPYESIRDRINNHDQTVFEDGTAKRVIEGIVIGTFLTPNFFASVFLVQRAHIDFIRNSVLGASTVSSTHVRYPSDGTNSRSNEVKEEKDEISKF